MSSSVPRENQGVSVTLAMRELNALILSAVDTRVSLILAAAKDSYETVTCSTCDGTGYVLMPTEDYVHCRSFNEGSSVPSRPNTPDNYTPPPSTCPNSPEVTLDVDEDEEMAVFLSLRRTGQTEDSNMPTDVPSAGPIPTVTPLAPTPVVAAPTPPFALDRWTRSSRHPAALYAYPWLEPSQPRPPSPVARRRCFTTPNHGRYYSVNRGIRVGVFSGW
ncbi:hypothetical protein FA13DRAFT_1718721 [Coprinellus micaceus]|uniref:Uncharacterized protein n=1 Tax=Coprinellus micaceus TaxID=71717 RepID=A0A4Y7SDA9_COPMI|nr:hypothetical protein FA13DRAFT_1718721 [Coprinellus micaceus]